MRKGLMLAIGLAVALEGAAERAPVYTLGIPRVPILRNVTNAADYQARGLDTWAVSNASVAFASAAYFETNRVVAAGESKNPMLPRRTVDSAIVGHPFERNKPQYYLGDELDVPDGVDWDATFALNFPGEGVRDNGSFLFATFAERKAVYVISGGPLTFRWVLKGGGTNEVTVIATAVAAARPKNIFWTDARYGGQTIDLSGKFVDLFGPSNILTKTMGRESTGTTIGGEESYRDVVVSGLYIEETAGKRTLFAAGELSGQVVLVYYDSPNRDRVVDVQVVEVSRPRTERMSGTVGGMLRPSGRGYTGAGLEARPTTLEAPDNYGPYLYQHEGRTPYSPKHKQVFALRPSDEKTRNQTQIYWMETDKQGVAWPFEIDEYLVTWPEGMQPFVRSGDRNAPGLPMTIPDDIGVELMKYQEGTDGFVHQHATEPVNGEFSSYDEGRALLKFTANDNVWFLPVQTVFRSNADWYDLKATVSRVGDELFFRGGSVSGVANGHSIAVDSSFPGWIYEPESDPVWNPQLYSASGTGWNGLPSAVFPVTAPMAAGEANAVEIWWSSGWRGEDMPGTVRIPALPQRYEIRWPTAGEVPEIASVSQLGSKGKSRFQSGSALVFDGEEASVALPQRRYFSAEGGTLALWTRPYDATARETACRLVTLGADTNGVPLLAVSLMMKSGGMVAEAIVGKDADKRNFSCPLPSADAWSCLMLSWTGDGTCTFAVADDRGRSGQADAQNPLAAGTLAALGEVLSGCTLGADGAKHEAASMRELDRVAAWNVPLAVDEAFARASRTLEDRSDGLTFGLEFEGDGELLSEGAGDVRHALDHAWGVRVEARKCLRDEPGAPVVGSVDLVSDVTPVIYRQNDPSATGFNPNEEHAFVTPAGTDYTVWALRGDLNYVGEKALSPPFALVQYAKDGQPKMLCFGVTVTNEFYSTFGDTCTAGLPLPGPKPLTYLENPWPKEIEWEGSIEDTDYTVPFRDRKLQLWARSAGSFNIFMYYIRTGDFDWPDGVDAPTVGEAVPWLAYFGDGDGERPHSWRWQVKWPESVPEMRIGQTLTTAAGGLPEVWNATSMAVVYPVEKESGHLAGDTVILADPTGARAVPLGFKASRLGEIGLLTGPGEKMHESKGYWYFRDLAPSLSNRLYVDPSNDTLVMKGVKESNPGGVELLHVNVLTRALADSVLALTAKDSSGEVYGLFKAALDEIVQLGRKIPTNVGWRWDGVRYVIGADYTAADHYALTAMGQPGYVVLVENDATNDWCNAGNPINMHIFKVVPEYYTGRVVTREDPLNLLSQVLGIHYSETFAGDAGDYVFDWRQARPGSDGTVPGDYSNWKQKFDGTSGIGVTEFTVGQQGDTLANMVNAYWTCRYRAREGTPAHATMGDTWSDWCEPPALAEGWVQRVLNNITPFAQRMTDLYENEAETAVSMIQQAGKPFEGDVALNQDNLTSVGLIELYRTILDKAESMSLMLGVSDRDANKQLMLAVERLADLYNVLGDEAYADAANPTIGFGSNFGDIEPGLTLDYGAASSALFCFDNQLPTLLDEELALLRGRSCVNAPGNTVGPYYNRLVWNFTKGITAGEVAYAVNYNISGHRSSTMTASTAAELYPQGHGDAYGHYLSALQGWYRLLRNPNFSWGTPAMGEMNVADNVVNVDYYDEAKFADTAAAVARTAKRTVELTALKHWRDNGADAVGGGYLDANPTNAFGYGEWASRGAFGALCNWAVANSLLPEAETTDESGAKYADKGLLRIDRSTVGGIGEIASAAESIQQTVDRMDAGLNPLGLDENAIPFDLTPIGSATDKAHYEQVRERAAKAFANAKAILDRAQDYGNRIRLLEEARAGIVDNLDTFEDDTCADLNALYGRPYSDDVGPGKTYPQDYYGPDLYHYMWMNNLSDFGLTSVEDTMVATTLVYKVASYRKEDGTIKDFVEESAPADADSVGVLTYSLSANGVVVKGGEIRGERPASGELQQAYADFLCTYAAVQGALAGYQLSVEKLQNEQNIAWAKWTALKARRGVLEDVYWGDDESDLEHQIERLENLKIAQAQFENLIGFNALFSGTDLWPIGVVGLATSSPGDAAKAGKSVLNAIVGGVLYATKDVLDSDLANAEEQISKLQRDVAEADAQYSVAADTAGLWKDVIDACDAHLTAIGDLKEKWRAMNEAQLKVSALVQKGRGISEGLELKRQQAVNNISKMRYNDMFFRKLRNDALAKYDAAFDLAKKYAFLAAKAYGYETGSMPEELVRTILAARTLGETDGNGKPIVSGNGDAGLAGALAKMDANWDNLKTQLGINSPQPYATWFSLRHELFRILRGKLGDEAWKTELAKHWVDDIRANPDFLRHCQPFASQFGLADREPGLVFTFETTVDFALNLFGRPLAYDDSQFDSSWYATKIASAGVWFENYNARAADYSGQESAFAATPNVYLVPVGTDLMRVPGSDGAEIAGFDVVDQTVPVPYPVTAAEIAEANWLPSYLKGEFGGVDAVTRIRRHPSFRASYGPEGSQPSDAQLDAVRLTGRSVWNTKWMLVIPAGTLNSNREKALKAFIGGLDVNGDGQIDLKGVSDIKIGFKTYSYGGK